MSPSPRILLTLSHILFFPWSKSQKNLVSGSLWKINMAGIFFFWNFFIRSRDMDGYERSQFVGRHFPSFTNVANSGKNCKKRLILFSSNPRKKTTSWQRFWKFEPWKMMTTREIAGRGGGGLSNLFPLSYFTYFPQMRASNLKFTTNFPLYRRGGGAQGVKKGTATPPHLSPTWSDLW